MDYLIFTDMSCDIDVSVLPENALRFIPMEYSVGDEMRTSVAPEDEAFMKRFYDGQRKGDLTKTTLISPFAYEEAVASVLAEGKSVLYLALSSGLSSTYQSALSAKATLKEDYPEVDFVPFDTLSATGGVNVLVERAVRNRAAGMSLEKNVEDLTALRGKISARFLVQDLNYLKRGGRVSAATAVVGTMLNIKPILLINAEGRLDTIDKMRGNKAAAQSLLDNFSKTLDPKCGAPVYVIHADAPDLAELLKKGISALYPELSVRCVMLSPIIGAHTGPGLAAIVHVMK